MEVFIYIVNYSYSKIIVKLGIRLDVTTAIDIPNTGNNWMGFSQFIESQNIKFLGHEVQVGCKTKYYVILD